MKNHLTSEQSESLDRFKNLCFRSNNRRRSLDQSEASTSLFQNEPFEQMLSSNTELENEALFQFQSQNWNGAQLKPDHMESRPYDDTKDTIAQPTIERFERTKNTQPQTDTKHCVQHNYHDHAFDTNDMYDEQPVFSKGGVTVPFPMKLYEMLDQIEKYETELSPIVSWQPHGRCFVVRKVKYFSETVLPRFFQQKKYASFQRQLNLYGFNRITKGPDKGSYYHELFLRGKKFLCRGISRMKVKGTGARMASNPEQEPNFYMMPPISATESPISSTAMTKDKNERTNYANSRGATQVCVTPQSSKPVHTSSTSTIMPPLELPNLKQDSSPTNMVMDKPSDENGIDDLNFVFDGMPFHCLTRADNRRHSLMDLARRKSLIALSRGNSLITPNSSESSDASMEADADFTNEMAFIAKLGEQDMSDKDMCTVLEKVIQKHTKL